MSDRLRDPSLFLALLLSLGLGLTAWVRPLPLGQMALATAGGVWAPGYALVAVAYPRGKLVSLERHALAFAAGLLLLPLVGLLASGVMGFRAAAIASALFGLTAALAWVALRHDTQAPEAAARSAMPDTRTTIIIAGACILAVGAIAALSWQTAPVPSSLALATAEGGVVPSTWTADAPPVFLVEAAAGGHPATGTLVVEWDGAPILTRELALEARAVERVDIVLPEATGAHTIEARWDGRVVRAHVIVGSAA